MNIETTLSGFIVISTIHNGHLIRQKYQGYSKRMATKRFKEHLKTLK